MSKKLPPLPAALSAPMGDVPVKILRNVIINGKVGYGAYFFLHRFIVLRSEMGPTMNWLTLEHERFHRIMHDAGIDFEKFCTSPEAAKDLHELVADALAVDRVYLMLHPDTPGRATKRRVAPHKQRSRHKKKQPGR